MKSHAAQSSKSHKTQKAHSDQLGDAIVRLSDEKVALTAEFHRRQSQLMELGERLNQIDTQLRGLGRGELPSRSASPIERSTVTAPSAPPAPPQNKAPVVALAPAPKAKKPTSKPSGHTKSHKAKTPAHTKSHKAKTPAHTKSKNKEAKAPSRDRTPGKHKVIDDAILGVLLSARGKPLRTSDIVLGCDGIDGPLVRERISKLRRSGKIETRDEREGFAFYQLKGASVEQAEGGRAEGGEGAQGGEGGNGGNGGNGEIIPVSATG